MTTLFNKRGDLKITKGEIEVLIDSMDCACSSIQELYSNNSCLCLLKK